MVKTITSQLWECINNSTDYSFKNDPLPVFYVLYACYCKVDLFEEVSGDPFLNATFSKDEWTQSESGELFDLIESKAKDSFQKNRSLFSDFYGIINKEYDIIKHSGARNDYDAYVYHYKQIVEFFIERYISLSGVVRPVDASRFGMLVVSLLARNAEVRYLYEYRAGCASLALQKHSWYIDDYLGYEPDEVLALIAKIRLNTHHIRLDSITQDSYSYKDWCFYSFPQFDRTLIKEALDKYLNGDSYSEMIITLPVDFCYSSEYQCYRSVIYDENLLDYIIYLPKNTFVGYDKDSILLCMSKWPDHAEKPEYFTIIDGRKMLKAGGADLASIEQVIWDEESERESVRSSNPQVWRHIPRTEYTKYNLLPSFCMAYMDRVDHRNDYTMVKIEDICEQAVPLEENGHVSAVVLDDANFVGMHCCDTYYPANLKEQTVSSDYVGYQGRSLVFRIKDNVLDYCIVDTDQVFYTSADHLVLSAKQPISGNWEYLCRQVLLAPKNYEYTYNSIQTLYEFAKEYINKLDFNNQDERTQQVYLAICNSPEKFAINLFLNEEIHVLSDRDKQESYVRSLYEDYRMLQEKEAAERANIATIEASADIAHMLGLSFNEIVTCAKSMEGFSETAKRRSDCIIANIDYMKRVLKTFGTDFDGYECVFKPQKINEFLRQHLESWSRLSRAIFNIEFDSSLPEDVEVNFDEMSFRIMIDAILENARRHGFGKVDNPRNLVQVHTHLLDSGDFVVLTFRNNGLPLAEGFSFQQFITKGVSFGRSGNTGIGGYHIHQIVKRHHGRLSVYSDENAQTVVEIHIPNK